MPEARDRIDRPEDIATVFRRRRHLVGSSIAGGEGASGPSGIFEILADEPEEEMGSRTRFRWGETAMTAAREAMAVAAASAGGTSSVVRRTGGRGTPRNGRGRNLNGSPATRIGSQNVFPGSGRGRAQGRGSVLPSWYPRTPLRDITAVVRALERRRARLGVGQSQNFGGLIPPQDQTVHDPSVSASGAQLEHDISMISPNPMIGRKPCPVSVVKGPMILLDIANQHSDDSGFLTPQKKLLNSIDTVEKVVMEELRKLKRAPSAKKAEREKRVRTLMTMR